MIQRHVRIEEQERIVCPKSPRHVQPTKIEIAGSNNGIDCGGGEWGE